MHLHGMECNIKNLKTLAPKRVKGYPAATVILITGTYLICVAWIQTPN